MYPGLGVKRWLLVGVIGLGAIVVGIWNIVNNQYTRDVVVTFVNWLEVVLPNFGFIQGVLFVIGGIGLICWGVQRFIKQYLATAFPNARHSYYRWKTLQQGPKIVVIGGGTGLSVLLRGLKEYSSNLTAIVSVGDDGGSSGRLREQFSMVPVGDIRNCIVALADQEDVMEQLFNYRFDQGQDLDGHSLGNLLLVAMSSLKGSFQDAVADINQVLHIRGKVLPVAVEPMTLKATLLNGIEIVGESNISQAWLPIERLAVCPEHVAPLFEVLEAIDEADAVILGPGSLYTSIIPNLLVEGVAERVKESKAITFYVCNVMTQAGETDGYSAEDHLRSLYAHSQPELVDYIVVNDEKTVDQSVLDRYSEEGAMPVGYDLESLALLGVKVVTANLLDADEVLRHNGHRLAQALLGTIYRDKRYRKGKGLIGNWSRCYHIKDKGEN